MELKKLKVLAAMNNDAASYRVSYRKMLIECAAIIAVTVNRVHAVISRVIASNRLIFSITANLQSMNTHEPKNQNYLKPEDQRSLNNLRGTLVSRKLINEEISLRAGSPVRFCQPGIGSARLDVYLLSLSDVSFSPRTMWDYAVWGRHA